MKAQGFFQFQTQFLPPESQKARAIFLVPSRIHPENSPRCRRRRNSSSSSSWWRASIAISSAPCFRDEDARADRSPGEFYQLDLEMSFVTQQDVFDAVEPVIRGVFEEFGKDKKVTPKFPLIPYAEALKKYGTDKPDLRNPIEMADVSEAFRGSGFKIFARILETAGNAVWAIPAPKGGTAPSATA